MGIYGEDSQNNIFKGGLKKNSFKFILKLIVNVLIFLVIDFSFYKLIQVNNTISSLILLSLIFLVIYLKVYCNLEYYHEPWSFRMKNIFGILHIRRLSKPERNVYRRYIINSWDYIILTTSLLFGYYLFVTSLCDFEIFIYVSTILFIASRLFSEVRFNLPRVMFQIVFASLFGLIFIIWIYSNFVSINDSLENIDVFVVISLFLLIVFLYWIFIELVYLVTLVMNQIYRIIYEAPELDEARKVFFITGLHGAGKTFFALKNTEYFNSPLEWRIIKKTNFFNKINYKSWRNQMLKKYSTKDTLMISCNGKTVDEIFRETIDEIENISNYPKYRKVIMKLMNKYIQISDIDKYSDYVFSNNVIQNLILDDIERFVALNSFREESKKLTKLFLKLSEFYNIILIANIGDNDSDIYKDLQYSLNKFPYTLLDISLSDSVKVAYEERSGMNFIIDECLKFDINHEELSKILSLNYNGGLRYLFCILDEYDYYDYRTHTTREMTQYTEKKDFVKFITDIHKVENNHYNY